MPVLSAPSSSVRSVAGLPSAAGRVLGVLLFLLFTACTQQTAMQPTADFDSDAWKAQRGAAPLEVRRAGMMSALEELVPVDMPRDAVVALLGEPDSMRQDRADAAVSIDVYELGVSGVGVEEEYYEIRYRDGRVASRRWSRR